MTKFYLTSAIPYVNSAPHVGHALEFVQTDCIRRYHELAGDDTFYLCGADENGLKIVQAAEKAKKQPKEFTDIKQQEFLDLASKLNVHFNVWQRATNKNHFLSSQKLWNLCWKNGDIYKKTYQGLYCVGCEAFYTGDELDENGQCPEHPGKKLENIAEENYFFRLSKYQKFLEELIESNRLLIIPEVRKNEALSFIKRGLDDFSISRSRQRSKNWGVPVPNDPEQIIYVWFDALNIYQSGIGFGWDEETYNKWWPADLHVIGKGILRFHAVYWITILKSAGLQIPKSLFIHGYLTVNGQKMSKTVGNVIDPVKIIDKFGCDPVRYYLLREIPSYGDGDFSERRFKELFNSDLANGLGNLVARVARLCEEIKINPTKSLQLSDEYKESIEKYQFYEVLSIIWEEIRSADRFIDNNEPWKIKDRDQLQKILQSAVDKIRQIAYELRPFLPQTTETIIKQFNKSGIKSEKPLFPRIK